MVFTTITITPLTTYQYNDKISTLKLLRHNKKKKKMFVLINLLYAISF